MSNWFRAHERTEGDLSHLRREHMVSYEWLITEPASVIAELTEFLSMPGTIDTSSVDASGSTRYEEEWKSLLADGNRGAVKAHHRFSARARSYGYDLDSLTVAPRHPLVERVVPRS
jgi:hypothetical protein